MKNAQQKTEKQQQQQKKVVCDVRNTYVFHFIWALPLSAGPCFHQQEETSFLEKSRGEGQIY